MTGRDFIARAGVQITRIEDKDMHETNHRTVSTQSRITPDPAARRNTAKTSANRLGVVGSAALLVALFAPSAPAATKYWAGDQGAKWNTSNSGNTNWSSTLGSNTNTTAPAASDDVIFNISSGAANFSTSFNATSYTLKSLTFNSSAVTNVTITTTNANPLTMNNADGVIVNVQTGTHKFVGSGVANSASKDFLVSGASTGHSFTFNVETGASFEIDGRIGTNRNDHWYIKTGGGVLILSAPNGGSNSWLMASPSPGFLINGGILRLEDNTATGNSNNPYTVAAGATLQLNNANYGSHNGTLTLNGSGAGGIGALNHLAGNSQIASGNGQVLLATDATIGVTAGSFTSNNPVNGAGGLTKIGSGTLTLTNASNAYAGTTEVNGGTLLVNGTLNSGGGAVNVNAGGTGVINRQTNLLAGGMFAPGTSAGTLTVNANTDLSAGVAATTSQSLLFELGTTSDLIDMTDGVSVLSIGTGVLEFDDLVITMVSGFASGTYTLIATDQFISGTLGANTFGSIVPGMWYGSLAIGDGGTDLVLIVVAPAPAALPAGLALLACAAARRRRR